MEDILNHLGCIKSCTQWDTLPISTGAEFLLTVGTVVCPTEYGSGSSSRVLVSTVRA